MSVQTPSLKLPVWLASLGVLLLLFGVFLLLANQQHQSSNSARQQIALELSDTIEELTAVVTSDSNVVELSPESGGRDTSGEWAYSDRLARLVATGDVQVKELVESHGDLNLLLLQSNKTVASEIGADWKLLREGLVSFNRAMQAAPQVQTQPEAQPEPETQPSSSTPAEAIPSITEVPQSVKVLASDFEQIRARVNEGTRSQPLLSLVNNSSLLWEEISNSQGVGLQALVAEQQSYADELLRLSGIGTDRSLFGFYTSDQILNFVQRVKNIQLPVPVPATESSVVEQPVVREQPSAAPVVVSNAFVTEALLQLQSSVSKFLGTTANSDTRGSLINWLALAALTTALLMLFAALWQMIRAARAVKAFAFGEAAAGERDVVTTADDSADRPATDRPATDRTRADGAASDRAIDDRQMTGPSRRGAMSVRDADQLIHDIDSIAGGDLRRSVRVPRRGAGKVIAESANRAAAVIQNLVGMTRGVASRIDGVVLQHDKLGQALAEHDIRRQSETAELSDSISLRSTLLDKQQLALTGSKELIGEIETRSESAVNGVNEVSTSLARVSAQVEISNGRLQRLLQTAGDATASINSLKVLAEQARLQALNVSLKMPEQNREQLFEPDTESTHHDADEGGHASGLFEDIHQLTARLVQVSGDTATLVTLLRNDIEETARSLKSSTGEINESARHTHASSLIGKELGSYCDQLQRSIEGALSTIETQKDELSQTARRIVRLDKTGNDTSELTLALTQDVSELQTMASRLKESVAGFKLDNAQSGVTAEAGETDSEQADSRQLSAKARNKVGDKATERAGEASGKSTRGEAPLA